ncbi:CHAT domain-containing protein [Svornostia abyssi]
MAGLGRDTGDRLATMIDELGRLSALGRWDEVVDTAGPALELARSIGRDDAAAVVLELLAAASLRREQGHRADNIDKAITAYQDALALTDESDRPAWFNRVANVAIAYGQRIHGDPRENLTKAEQLLRNLLNDLHTVQDQGLLDLRSNVQTNLAVLLGLKLEGDEVERATEARMLCEHALSHRTPERNVIDWAYSQINLAVAIEAAAALGVGELREAEEVYEEVLVRSRDVEVTDATLTATARLNLANVLLKQVETSDVAGARNSLLDRAADILAAASSGDQDRILRARILRRAATVEHRRGRQGERAALLDEAVNLVKPSEAPTEVASAALELAFLHHDDEDWVASADAFAQALEAIDLVIEAPIRREHREDLARDRARVHRWAAYAFARAGRPRDAVVAIENGRTRDLRRQLQLENEQISLLAELSPGLAAELRSLTSRRVLAPDDENLAAELAATTLAIRELPGLERFGLGVRFEDLAAASSPDKPLVYINPTPHGTVTLLVRSDGTVVHQIWAVTSREVAVAVLLGLDPDAVDLDGISEQWEENEIPTVGASTSFAFAAGGSNETDIAGSLDTLLPWLGRTVGEPLADLLTAEGTRAAAIVSSGPLASVPLAAIPRTSATSAGSLLDEFTLSAPPSGSAHSATLRRAARRQDFPPALLAVADPTHDLAAARGEVQVIAGTFPDSRVLIGDDGTMTALDEHAPEATHLHLACHGQGGLLGRDGFGLHLADGLVSLDALSRLRLERCRLAVASACQSATIDLSDELEEAISVGVALLAGGAASAIASLWPVDDFATSLLMSRLYERLRGDARVEPDTALREAQVWLRDLDEVSEHAYIDARPALRRQLDERVARGEPPGRRGVPGGASRSVRPYAHPDYWAAFIAMGS